MDSQVGNSFVTGSGLEVGGISTVSEAMDIVVGSIRRHGHARTIASLDISHMIDSLTDEIAVANLDMLSDLLSDDAVISYLNAANNAFPPDVFPHVVPLIHPTALGYGNFSNCGMVKDQVELILARLENQALCVFIASGNQIIGTSGGSPAVGAILEGNPLEEVDVGHWLVSVETLCSSHTYLVRPSGYPSHDGKAQAHTSEMILK